MLGLLGDRNSWLRAQDTRKALTLSLAPLPAASLSRQALGASSASSASLPTTQTPQSSLPLPQPASATASSNPQQELQAKILSLFNSGAAAAAAAAITSSSSTVGGSQAQSFPSTPPTQSRAAQLGSAGLAQSQQRPQGQGPQFPNHPGPARNVVGPRAAPPQTSQPLYQNRPPAPSNAAAPRAAPSSGINFDNPSVQKALDTLIQSGPALSHLVSQTVGQLRAGPPAQQPLGSYQRHY